MKYSAFLVIVFLCSTHLSFAQKADETEVELLIDRHNFWRADVGVAPINYSEELAEVANKWAIQLKSQGCAFKHSQNAYGENLFKGTVGYFTAGDAVDSWGSEKQDYDYKKNKCTTGKMCGHYTQIVWENTTEVGCAKSICDGSVIWVCNYNPAGNYVGQQPY
ncbi:pathogenesis-related family 1 protein [Reichenbachiella carrageenanivorans]|uniref:Pathogenesis-related family 1 protein n=1 Tax=Reichenbachiella carrageenanivorans TaxID=2979869 RepID=A0ABY6CY73_9BACT|nr:pathogenesis-related family 1 protein [Reichenbachiella carrageenanivorans]UXX78869.1 pathogenesis-related family 1 protein [Reichenbachiella carrageenanivorans]